MSIAVRVWVPRGAAHVPLIHCVCVCALLAAFSVVVSWWRRVVGCRRYQHWSHDSSDGLSTLNLGPSRAWMGVDIEATPLVEK